MKNIFALISVVTLSVILTSQLVNAQANGDVAPDQSSNGCTDLSYNLTYKKSKDANTNGEVSDLQYFLQDQGLFKFEPNGIFGPATLRAVQKFQKQNGFISSGYVGPVTRAKIKEMSCNQNTDTTSVNTSSNKVCRGIGTKSEGWYDSITGELIDYASCSTKEIPEPVSVSCSRTLNRCSDGSFMPRDADCKWREDKCPVNVSVDKINVLSPTEGETFTVGQNIPVKWITSDNVLESIQFSGNHSSGDVWAGVQIENVVSGKRIFLGDAFYWKDGYKLITLKESSDLVTNGEYRLRVYMYTSDGEKVAGYSKVFKVIAHPVKSITLLSPNTGKYWYPGTTETVTWSSAEISSLTQVLVRLRSDLTGQEYNLTTVNNIGTASFIVPTDVSVGTYYIEVKTSVDNQSYVDASDQYIKILNQSANLDLSTKPAPTIEITGIPNNIDYGGQSRLNWSSTNADNCKFIEGDSQFISYENTISGTNRYTQDLYATRTYTLSCVGKGGETIKSITINVAPKFSQSVIVSTSTQVLTNVILPPQATTSNVVLATTSIKYKPGTYTYIVPENVYTIKVTGTGAGGSGWQHGPNPAGEWFYSGAGGAGIVDKDIKVTPGESLTVVVGSAGGQSTYLKRGTTDLISLGGGGKGGTGLSLGGVSTSVGSVSGKPGISQSCGMTTTKPLSGGGSSLEIAGLYGFGGYSNCDGAPSSGGIGYLSIKPYYTVVSAVINGTSQVLGAFTSCLDIPRNMHRGEESIYVKKLQAFLNQKGMLEEQPTGFYGDETISAVKDYQATNGLPTTGMLYDFTRQAIKNETCQ